MAANQMTADTITQLKPRVWPPRSGSAGFWNLAFGPPVQTVIVQDDISLRWLPYVLDRLNELGGRLADANASGEGVSPDERSLARALPELLRLLSQRTPSPSVVPTADRGVQFSWHMAGWDLEIEVLPEETEIWVRNRLDNRQWSGSSTEIADLFRLALSAIETASERRS